MMKRKNYLDIISDTYSLSGGQHFFCLLRRFAGAKAGRNDGNGSYHDTDPGER